MRLALSCIRLAYYFLSLQWLRFRFWLAVKKRERLLKNPGS